MQDSVTQFRTATTTILSALFNVAVAVSSFSAHAQGKLDAQYAITMTRVPIGHIAWHVDIGNNLYATSATGKASGVLSVLVNGQGSAVARGNIVDGHATPTNFGSNIFDNDGKTELRLLFSDGAAKETFIHEPPKKPELVPVSEADRRGVADPLSAMLIPSDTRGVVLESANCNRVLPIFDGQRRYNLVLTYRRMDKVKTERGYSGPVLVCGATLKPIGGYHTDSMVVKYVANRRDIELWFAPITGTSMMAPILVMVPTLIGALRIQAEQFETVALSERPVLMPSNESPR